MKRVALTLALVGALALAASWVPVSAQAPSDDLPYSRWSKDLAQVEKLLVLERYDKAEARLHELVRKMILGIGFYAADERAPARAMLYLALAEAGLGKEHEALWYLDVARNLDRRLARDDLRSFGPLATELARTPHRPLGEIPADLAAADTAPRARPTGHWCSSARNRVATTCPAPGTSTATTCRHRWRSRWWWTPKGAPHGHG